MTFAARRRRTRWRQRAQVLGMVALLACLAIAALVKGVGI